jgi:hypothetical protein
MLAKLEKQAQMLFEHKPKELRVAVNGNFQGTLKVTSDLNEIDLLFANKEPIEFIEIYSEQQMRLLFVNIESSVPHPTHDSAHTLHLSDERKLELNFGFAASGAEIKLRYQDPTFKEIQMLLENPHLLDNTFVPPISIKPQTSISPTFFTRLTESFSKLTYLFSLGWRRLAFVGLTLVMLVGGFIFFERQNTLSADAILKESEIKNLNWRFEPGKIKHVVWEETLHNSPRSADGRYISHHWFNNLNERQESLILKYDSQNNLIWARWNKSDGTVILFDIKREKRLEITPSFAAIKEQMSNLSEADQFVLQRHLEKEEREIDVRKVAETETNWMLTNYQKEIVKKHKLDDQNVVCVFLKSDRPTQGGRALESQRELDFDAKTYRKIYDRSVYFLKNGSEWIEEARPISEGESTLEEFENNELARLLALGQNIKYVSVAEYAEKLRPFYPPKKQ